MNHSPTSEDVRLKSDTGVPARTTSSASPPGASRRAVLLIVAVFGFLAIVAAGFLLALKLTEPDRSLMDTTATAEDDPSTSTKRPAEPTIPREP